MEGCHASGYMMLVAATIKGHGVMLVLDSTIKGERLSILKSLAAFSNIAHG